MGTSGRPSNETHYQNVRARDESDDCKTVLQGATAVGPNPLPEGSVLRVTGGRPPTVALHMDRCYRLSGVSQAGETLDDSAVYVGDERGVHRFRIDNSACLGCG